MPVWKRRSLVLAPHSCAEFVENDEMMGDPGTSDTTDPELHRRSSGSCFPDPAMVPHEPSASSSAIDLHGHPPPDFQFPHFQLDHHRAASFRHDGSEELRNQAGQPVFKSHIGQLSVTDDSGDPMTSTGVFEDVLLTYPRGEGDAVTITATDVEGLGPGKLVSDNIIDFYIKHLNREIVSRDSKKQQRIHFLSSFFFTKFLKSTEFGGRILREDDYVQLQRWIRDAKLFEKDYIFIPVVQRSHWSLIVICHLARLVPNARGEMDGSPYILHLDPMKGVHECFEGQVKGFLHHAYLKTNQGGYHLDGLLTVNRMKYVQAEVPQQGNDYDCGMYILHYIEVFLSKWTSGGPSFHLCQGGDQFTSPNFGMEVSKKRSRIQSLIEELCGRTQELDSNPSNFQEKPQEDVAVVQQLRPQRSCLRSRAKETKSKKFTQEETSVLLQCMLNVGRFGIKEKQGYMQWDLISQEINKCDGGRSRSDDQCRHRFDTLLKAYKKLETFCGMNHKTFGEITDFEKESMNLATPLKKENEAWFNDLRAICSQRASLKGKAAKRQKLEYDGDTDINRPESSHLDSAVQRPMPSEPTGSVHPKKAASKQVAIPRFGDLDIELKCTLLNMIQACSMNSWTKYWNTWATYLEKEIGGIGRLEEMCRMLAIVQDQNPLEICKHVYDLMDLGVVSMVGCPQRVQDMDGWKDYQEISLSRLKVFKKFGEKVLRKNPHLRTFQIACGDAFKTRVFPLQQIRALTLSSCQEVEYVDLGNFPELRFLHIDWCEKLKSVGGWEVVHKLGWIEICNCSLYYEFPIVQCLPSLKEFTYRSLVYKKDWQSIDFSKCVPLRRLRMEHNWIIAESMEFGALKCLEVLSFWGCANLSTIHGLKGLHALAKLDLHDCCTLRRVPELGCLKALTHLDMKRSGIVEIPGVEALHLLTSLNLSYCRTLESLPFLGDLKALAHLYLSPSGIQEIFGIEDLINLKTLECQGSKLLKLPKLEHLPHLQNVDITGTPLSKEMHPLKPLCWNNPLIHSSQDKGTISVDNVSDISDTGDLSSNASSSSED